MASSREVPDAERQGLGVNARLVCLGFGVVAWLLAAISVEAQVSAPVPPAPSYQNSLSFGVGYGVQLKGGPKEGVFNVDPPKLETIGVSSTWGGLQQPDRNSLFRGQARCSGAGCL